MAINKRKRINLLLIFFLIIIFGVFIYYNYPKIFGDVVYPIKYETLIVKYAREYALEPSFVAAIIYTESRFNANATSHAGAQGLMQIMPSTGEAIAGRLGEEFGDLYDPETSIRYGTSYIRSLVDAYNLDYDAALAAYNAGSGAADRYVFTRSDDSLPMETSAYIKKVNNAQKIYNDLHGGILNAQNIAEALKIKEIEEQKSWVEKILDRFNIFKK